MPHFSKAPVTLSVSGVTVSEACECVCCCPLLDAQHVLDFVTAHCLLIVTFVALLLLAGYQFCGFVAACWLLGAGAAQNGSNIEPQ